MSDKKDEKTAAIKSNNTDSGQLNGTADLKSDTADKRESAPTFAMHNVSPPTESPEENKEKKTIDVLPDGTGDDASDQEGENGSYCESLDDRNDAGAEVEPDLNGARGGAATMTDLVPTPPDGGYGWIVVLAAFVSNFIVDGTSNSFGAFITTYQEHFGESKAIVSLIGSILIGSYLLIGPFASGLLNKYGARVVVVVGSVLSGLSFAASTLSPNVYVYMFFYGFLSGIGFGFIYVPAVVFVSFYFEKKRSLATGLAVAGSGVGTFAMPPMCIYFLNNYGWKITVGVLAGCALLCGAFGLLYKPLESPKAVDDAEKEPLRVDDEEMQRPASDLSCHQNHSDSPKRENSVPINATTEDGKSLSFYS
ncbi:hypothetical protein AB6A40_007765 [Gnathostoma spinigerum]|uniref:Major facilitator superfamily (MFS) profile domain-containing protein n=1 Tax=Gnathostoma spinigerum TaxID=75299 RepID=A0ABD6EUE0_9BILA